MIKEIQALRVGPDEVLILHIKKETLGAVEDEYDALGELQRVLEDVGLGERAAIIVGDVEFSVVKK